MPKSTNNIIKILFILMVAALGGGLMWYVNSTWHLFEYEEQTRGPVVENPENILDEAVEAAGVNYIRTVNDDFTVTYKFHGGNVQYMTDNGDYELIDNTIIASDQEEFAYENTTNVFKTYFSSDTGGDETIKFEVAAGRGVEFLFKGANVTEAQTQENTVTYTGVYEDVDVKYTVTEEELLEEFIAHKMPVVDKFSQKLVLNNVYYKERPDGSITFHDKHNQNIVFIAPKPVMYELEVREESTTDENGKAEAQYPPISYGLHYEITEEEGEIVISKVIDEAGKAWLEKANYPVAIDGTFTYRLTSNNMSGFVHRDFQDYGCDDPEIWGYEDLTSTNPEQTNIVGIQYPRGNCNPTGASRVFNAMFLNNDFSSVSEEQIVEAKIRLSIAPYCFSEYNLMPTAYYSRTCSLYSMGGDDTDLDVYTGIDTSDYTIPIDSGGVTEAEIIDLYNQIGSLTNYEGTLRPPNLGENGDTNEATCNATPATCTFELDVSPASIAGRQYFKLALREDSMPYEGQVNEENWKGVRVFNYRASADLEPVLTVVIMKKPLIVVVPPDQGDDTELDIEIVDVSDNEDGWELEWSADGLSGWTNVCTLNTGTYTDEPCAGGGAGTYSCSTSKSGTGNICTVTNTGLTSDTIQYYRARAYSTSPANYSVYSDVDSDWTVATPYGETTLIIESPAWNQISATGTGNMTDWTTHPNPSYTHYVMGVYQHYDGSASYSIRFTQGDPTGCIFPLSELSGPPYSSTWGWDRADWMILGCLGIGYSGTFYIEGDGSGNTLWPNRDTWLGEYSRDTRTPRYLHEPVGGGSSYGFPYDFHDTYTRARLPSAPINHSENATGTTLELEMDITPYDSRGVAGDSIYTNPSHNSYAMQECKDNNPMDGVCDADDDWEYLGANECDRSSTPNWYKYDSGSPNWGGINGRTYGCFEIATCYVFRATSKNDDGIMGDGYADYSDAVQYCTPLETPDAPTVACNYDGINGYYCNVTINDTVNPSPPYYYKVEVSNDGSSGWSTVMNWSNAYQNGNTVRFNWLTCAAGQTARHYRVSAALDASGSGASSPSSNGTDTLPPCQPGTPEVDTNFGLDDKGATYIGWAWTDPVSGEPITKKNLYDYTSFTTYDVSAGPPYTRSGLTPNTGYRVRVHACDRSSTTERCGAWSANSAIVYTYTNKPSIAVGCDYGSGYYCNVDVTEGSPENPKGTDYQLQYCLPDAGDDCTSSSADWKAVQPVVLGYLPIDVDWFNKDWKDSKQFVLSDATSSFLQCNVANTHQEYRILARNEDGDIYIQEIGFPTYPTDNDTLPPCQPRNIDHTNQGTNALQWTWEAPSGGETPSDYVVTTSGCGTSQVTTYPTVLYQDQGGTPLTNSQCNVSISARDSRLRNGKSSSYSRYTSIEEVASISFTDVQENQLVVKANPSGADFSNLGTGASGIQFQETSGNSGGGGDDFFPGSFNDWTTLGGDGASDLSLLINRQYCYQARSRNGDGVASPDPDTNAWKPDSPTCKYTLAHQPEPPVVTRSADQTQATVAIRAIDGNPHGGTDPDTEYAMCVRKYDNDNVLLYAKYYNPAAGSIDESGDDCHSDFRGTDGYGYWATYDSGSTNWGGSGGINITGLSGGKYSFEFTARNGDNIETGFGAAATLFVVKNNIVGWAWSSHYGWISLNCLNLYSNEDFIYSCEDTDHWGLNTEFEPSRDINPMEGYAWSASGQALDSAGQPVKAGLGWISLYSNVCSNDTQVGCTVDTDCDVNGGIWFNAANLGATPRSIIEASNGTLYAATEPAGDVYKSTDNGDTWTNTGNLAGTPDPQYAYSIIEASDGNLYAATGNDNGDVYKSTDGGDNWAIAGTLPDATRIHTVLETSSGALLAGTEMNGYIYKSTDGGATWTDVGFSGGSVWSMIKASDGTLYAGTEPAGDVYKSTDGGDTWLNTGNLTDAGTDATGVYSLAEDNTGMLYAGTTPLGRVFRSNDGGSTWVNTNTLNGGAIESLVADVEGTIYAGTNGSNICESSDQGDNWSCTGPVGLTYALMETRSGTVFAGVGNDIFRLIKCRESAGAPPDSIAYGNCYNDAGARYGVCSDNSAKCTESDLTLCSDPSSAACILETCKTGDTCSDYDADSVVDEVCKAFATASFNGVTMEVNGWARVLSMKQAGERQGFNDWGWVKLGGQYDNGQGNTGPYNITGTEVDSQEFLGDPDVNVNDVQLYGLFGWGWSAVLNSYSSWLNPDNVSRTLEAAPNIHAQAIGKPSIAIDSFGDPHIAWSNEYATNDARDIYYLKLKGGQWQTASGEIYQPGVTDPVTSGLNVTNTTGESIWPSLALDSSDNPHIAWQEGGSTESNGTVYYTKWNSNTNSWETAELVENGGLPSLQLDRSGQPHIAYRYGSVWSGSNIYYRWRDSSSNWVTASGDTGSTDVNVSNTSDGSWHPSLALSSETIQRPHVSWAERRPDPDDPEIYYRWWNGTNWVTASGDVGTTDLSLNPGNLLNSENNDLALNASNLPGIVWRDDSDNSINYRTWDGANWVTASGDVGTTNLKINIQEGGDPNHYTESEEWPALIFDSSDRPHVVWSDDILNAKGDIHYRYWDPSADSGNGAWVTVSGDYTVGGPHFDDADLDVDTSPSLNSRNATLALDQWGNSHVAWNETEFSSLYCGKFGSAGGVITGDEGAALDVAIDNNYMYVVGRDGNYDWRIEKRQLSDGSLVSSFGTNGVVTGDGTSKTAQSIAIDSDYMYVAGQGDNQQWRVEKRRLSDGSLCTDTTPCNGTGFGFNEAGTYSGDGTIIGDNTTYEAYSISVDPVNGYMYIVGNTSFSYDWRIEKRQLSDGSLVSSFGTNGVLTSDSTSNTAFDISIDSSYMYAVGYTSDALPYYWRIEKRQLSDGSLVSSFGTNGVVTGGIDNAIARTIAIDTNYMYVAGDDQFVSGDLRIEKRQLSDGSLVSSFGTNGAVTGDADSYRAYDITLSTADGYMYVVGEDDSSLNWPLRIEKRQLSDGLLCDNTLRCGGVEFGTNGVVKGGIDTRAAQAIAIDSSYLYTAGYDIYNPSTNWRIEKRWLDTGALDSGISDNDCTDSSYPQCTYYTWDSELNADYYQCAALDVMYSRWTPGRVLSGLGWVEFFPVGELLGVPYLQTQLSDIYSSGAIQLAPPPRGSGQYTATYLILANGSIQGISGSYSLSQQGQPTSALVEPGLDPLIEDAGYPLGQNALSKIDVDALITQVNSSTKNKYGHEVVDNGGGGDLSTALGSSPVLNGKVYYFNGNSKINSDITITKGDSTLPTSGNGLIVVDGDLEINANVLYDNSALLDISEMPSVAFIVRGNIYINSFVDQLGGVFVGLDNPNTASVTEGTINTSRKEPVTYTVTISADDAVATYNESVFSKDETGATIKFGYEDSGLTEIHRAFLRWPIAIPAGSEIRNAYIRLVSKNSTTADPDFNAKVYLIADDNISAFDDGAFSNAEDLYSIAVSRSVNYDTSGWDDNTDGAENKLTDIASFVQRFIDEPGYVEGNYMGIVIKEGNAKTAAGTGDAFKEFYAWDDAGTGNEPQLVIEYSPRRTVYEIEIENDDVPAWGTAIGSNNANFCYQTEGAECDADTVCMNFGSYPAGVNNDNSIFYRFSQIDPAYQSVPSNAEILQAQLKVDGCATGGVAFQARQGLLDFVDMPFLSSNEIDPVTPCTTEPNCNPYNAPISQAVSEVAEDISGAWGAGETLKDISTLVQAWVDMNGYTAGNHIGLRLRGTSNEDNAYRSISNMTSKLYIDFRVPLRVSGLFIARGFNFDRKYSKELAAAEQIVYDGRAVANTPPGLADYLKIFPIYQRVTP